jgi:hypothetical protein
LTVEFADSTLVMMVQGRRTPADYLRAARFDLWTRASTRGAYLAWCRRRGSLGVIAQDTGLVIEGYQRSANTFSTIAFQIAQPSPVPVAHHHHAPAQIIRATRLGIPVLALVRHPRDAAVSVTIRSPYVSLELALAAYTRFYASLLPYRDGCMVGMFEEVTRDLGAVIERLNQRYGSDFTPFQHTEENVRAVYALIDDRSRRPPWAPSIQAYVSGRISKAELDAARNGHGADLGAVPEARVARPSGERAARAEAVLERYQSPALTRLREQAEAAYRAFAHGE